MLAKCPDSSKYIFSTSFKVDKSCDLCFSSLFTEEQVSRLEFLWETLIQLSIYFKSSHLDRPNQPFCGVINQDVTSNISLIKLPELLIVHLILVHTSWGIGFHWEWYGSSLLLIHFADWIKNWNKGNQMVYIEVDLLHWNNLIPKKEDVFSHDNWKTINKLPPLKQESLWYSTVF